MDPSAPLDFLLWTFRWQVAIIIWPTLLYKLVLEIAWYIAAYLAFLTDKCPREPQLHDADGALICYGLIAFVIICVDQLRLQASD